MCLSTVRAYLGRRELFFASWLLSPDLLTFFGVFDQPRSIDRAVHETRRHYSCVPG